ncbi:MAG: DUF6691 family protein [Pseudaminobacter sp.]
MSFIVNLFLGLLFGIGLVVSGMANPAKVLNFLDLAGTWDPSLIFVMGGAVVVAFIGYRYALKRPHPLMAPDFQLPAHTDIDMRLLAGAAIFGLGWGLAGFCPGPALTSLALAETGTLVFVPAMFIGMLGARLLAHR